MAGCCGKTSGLLKTAAFLTLLAFIFLLLGFATPLWSSRTGSNEGLWEECMGNTCFSVIGTTFGSQAWFISVQILMTLALITAFITMVVAFVIVFHLESGTSMSLRIVVVVHEFVTAVLLLISVIVYWIKGSIFYTDFFLNFSWGITVAALIVFVIGGIFLFVDIHQLEKSDEENDDSIPVGTPVITPVITLFTDPDSTPDSVNSEEPPTEGTPDSTPDSVISEEPPTEGTPDSTPDSVNSDEPPTEGIPDSTLDSVTSEEPPAEGTPDSTPENATSEESPADITIDITPGSATS